MKTGSVLALDLGASSGRLMRVRVEGGRMAAEPLYRFEYGAVSMDGCAYWNILGIYENVIKGLRLVQGGNDLSLGIDAWANDFVLLDGHGRLMELPYCYRDKRTTGIPEAIGKLIPPRALYARNGIQQMRMNTLYQVYSLVKQRPDFLSRAGRFFFIPDYLAYLLTGAVKSEYTLAVASQMFDFASGGWDRRLMQKLGIPCALFAPIAKSMETLGTLRAMAGGNSGLPVIAVGAHDTGSAMLAASDDPNVLVISSGTWSVIGYASCEPLLTDEAFAAMLSNEGGALGGYRVIKNVMGLWIFQEIVRGLRQLGKPGDYQSLMAEALAAEPMGAYIDPDDERFYEPKDMTAEILRACGAAAPATLGALLRCVFESLAMKYRLIKDRMERARGRVFRRVMIVGGGSQNTLLNQLTADYLQLPVDAGLPEATAIGNGMVQFMANGMPEIEARVLVGESFPKIRYEPADDRRLEAHYWHFFKDMQSYAD